MRHGPFIFIALLAALFFGGAAGAKAICKSNDNLHRIKTYTGLTGSYAYDAVGNITNSIESGSSQEYG